MVFTLEPRVKKKNHLHSPGRVFEADDKARFNTGTSITQSNLEMCHKVNIHD